MDTKPDKKDKPQQEEQSTISQESSEEEAAGDQLELDSDIEMEGLVDSITSKERSMKK